MSQQPSHKRYMGYRKNELYHYNPYRDKNGRFSSSSNSSMVVTSVGGGGEIEEFTEEEKKVVDTMKQSATLSDMCRDLTDDPPRNERELVNRYHETCKKVFKETGCKDTPENRRILNKYLTNIHRTNAMAYSKGE